MATNYSTPIPSTMTRLRLGSRLGKTESNRTGERRWWWIRPMAKFLR